MRTTVRKKGDNTKNQKSVSFSLDAPEAKTVSVAGHFNHWNTTSDVMKKNKEGIWSCSVRLAPGQYEYLFFVDGEWTFDPACDCSVGNVYGSENCLIVVE